AAPGRVARRSSAVSVARSSLKLTSAGKQMSAPALRSSMRRSSAPAPATMTGMPPSRGSSRSRVRKRGTSVSVTSSASRRAEAGGQDGGGGRVPVHEDDVVAEAEADACLRADEPDEHVDDRGVVAPARFAPQLVQRGPDAARVLDGGRREQRGEVAGDGED